MKKRNLFAVFILSFLTGGIYELYWSYVVRKDLIAINKDEKSIPPIHWLLIMFYVAAPVAILALLSALVSKSIFEPLLNAGMLVLIISLFASIFIYLWWYWHFCNTFSRVVKGNDATLIYILWIISRVTVPVWNLMGQSDINKYLENQKAAKQGTQSDTSSTQAAL